MRALLSFFLIQIIDLFLLLHWKDEELFGVKRSSTHFYCADFSATVRGKIIDLIFGVHTRGVDGPEPSAIGFEKTFRLIDGAKHMKKARDRVNFTVSRQGIAFGICDPYKARGP